MPFIHTIRYTGIIVLLFSLTVVTVNAQAPKHLKKPKLAAVPIINYNESFGGIFGGGAAVYFPLNKQDTISPASSAGAGGIITSNKTWFTAGFTKLFYKEDLLRTVVAGGIGNENFQYFNENIDGTGSFIQYSSFLKFFFAEQLIRVYGRLYTGVDLTFYNAETSFETGGEDVSARNYVALGIPVTLDSRDNVQNATTGWLANARLNRFDEAFGSAAEYTKLDMDVSNYLSEKINHTIAWKVSVSTALGSVPFEGQTVVGGRVLRGYSEGKYRGDQVYAMQGEYRWSFYEKWGAVFFAGVATPVSEDEEWKLGDLLPAAGAGIRYRMIPDIRLNVGFDAAIGKGDYGIYFRIGEAF